MLKQYYLMLFGHYRRMLGIRGCRMICFIIVTPMILLAYAVEGRKNVQATSLDALFSFAGACMLIAVGGKLFKHLVTIRILSILFSR